MVQRVLLLFRHANLSSGGVFGSEPALVQLGIYTMYPETPLATSTVERRPVATLVVTIPGLFRQSYVPPPIYGWSR